MGTDTTSATESAETETGEQTAGAAQTQEATTEQTPAGTPATETTTEEAGEQTEEEKAAAEAAAEAKREEQARENTPGTMEFYRKKANKEKDARQKLGISITKEREARIRAEARADTLAEIAANRKTAETTAKEPAEIVDGEPELVLPDMNDFNGENGEKEWRAATAKVIKDYNKAVVKHELSRGTTEREAKTAQEKAVEDWNTQKSALRSMGEKEYPDYADVVNRNNLPFTDAMAVAIVDLKDPHTAYFLGLDDNKAEFDRIAALSSARQIIEIGRLSDKLRGARATKPKETNAPPPIKPLKGGTTPLPKTIAETKTSEERFAIWEREQKEAQRS